MWTAVESASQAEQHLAKSPARALAKGSRAACGVPVWQGAQSPRLRRAERPGPDHHPGFAPSRCVGFKIEPRQPPAIPGTDVRLQATKVEKWDEWGAELFSSCLWARSELTTVLCNQPKRRLLDVTPFHCLAEARPGRNVCTRPDPRCCNDTSAQPGPAPAPSRSRTRQAPWEMGLGPQRWRSCVTPRDFAFRAATFWRRLLPNVSGMGWDGMAGSQGSSHRTGLI